MIKLALLLKLSLISTVALAVAVISAVDDLGIPHGWQLLINGIVIGYTVHALASSYVGGMVRPDKTSSRRYIHYFNTAHLLFHRSTALVERLAGLELLTDVGGGSASSDGTDATE